MTTKTIADFTAGQRVRYDGPKDEPCRHPDRIGQFATVKRTVKSRKVVTITWEGDGQLFDAAPGSLEHAGGVGVQSGGVGVQSASEKLPVIFRKHDGEVTALFPTLGEGYGHIRCYAHVGQHGQATLEFMRTGKLATPDEYADLLAELRGIYERADDAERVILDVRERDHPSFRAQRAKGLNAGVIGH